MTAMQPDRDWDESTGVAQAIRRYWWVVALAVVAGALAAYLFSARQTPLYTATAQMLLASPRSRGVLGDELGYIDPTRNVLNQAERAMSTPVLAEAAESLDGVGLEVLRGAVSTEGSIETDVVTVSATHTDAQTAADIANAVTDAYQETVRQEALEAAARSTAELEETRDETQDRLDRLQRRLENNPDNTVLQQQADGLVAQIVTLETRIEQINVNASLEGGGVEFVEPAVAPLAPSRPRPRRTAAAGGVLAAIAATAVVTMFDRRRRKADRRMDPAVELRAPLLGSVPDLRTTGEGELPTVTAPRSAAAEAYQMIVGSVMASVPADATGHAVLITSAEAGEGKTLTALNLAIAAHHADRDVLLVDADTRMRGLSRRLKLSGVWGLTELQEAADSLVWWEYRHTTPQTEDMEIVPVGAGIPDPAGFFRSARFLQVLQRMRAHADMVFIDSPPILAVSDTLAIAQGVDGVVLVVNQGTPLDVLTEVRRRLDFVATPILGYVFNRADTAADPYGPYAYELDPSGEQERTP